MSIKKATIDGNTAAAHVAYAFSDVAAIYPITPSSNMGELADSWAADGRKNIFGQEVEVIELQSEGGASGAVHGALSAGSLTTTFTASQGLLLMIPNMHKIAGEMLPTVFHVSARSLACQSLSIFGDHSDVMSVRNTGFALVAAASVQETMDLAVVSHLATLESKVPFLNFFDGFRTSHEIQKVEMIDYETMAALLDMKLRGGLPHPRPDPGPPGAQGRAADPRCLFPGPRDRQPVLREAPGHRAEVHGPGGQEDRPRTTTSSTTSAIPRRSKIVVAMGSACETIEETVEYLNKKGAKLGLIKVRLYRPFSAGGAGQRPAQVGQEDRRPRPHQGARRPGRTPVHGRGHRPGQPRADHHRRPLRPQLQGVHPGHGQGGLRPPGRRLLPRFHRGHQRRRLQALHPGRRRPLHRKRATPSAASSGASAPTAPSAPTRTPSRSSATTPTCTPRATSPTTRRNRAASPSPTCASARAPSAPPTCRPRPTSSPCTTRPTSAATTCSRASRKAAPSCSTPNGATTRCSTT